MPDSTLRRRLLLTGLTCALIFCVITSFIVLTNHDNLFDQWLWHLAISERADALNPLVARFTQAFNTVPQTIYATVAAIALSWAHRSAKPFFTIACGMVVAPGLMWVIKRIIDRLRPAEEFHLVPEYAYSFPSGHATGITALSLGIYLAAYALMGRTARVLTGVTAGILILAVAASRIYAGVHWGTDVLAGILLGACITLLGYAVFPEVISGRTPGTLCKSPSSCTSRQPV
ncbi:phosphatase PAP2 family protein [Rothia sp. ZJ1223]|uniref:phosphatase PAP2 family protein n=1 Tax=Rothia sp. ZJ1223 TaxID=2811098 RepID=UPI0019587489|nr:phosphatase PAP2 family protein [Rothia sp. ZJ1223]MBM7052104.1 phosphatase PAP2 family protein [Rothia sp. ZJ1223]